MRGSLFLLVQVKEASSDKAESLARQLFTSYKERFYSAAGSNLKVMEEATDLTREFVKQRGEQVDLVAANLWGSVLYIAKLGDAGAILVRAGAARKIEVTKAASGSLQDKDNIFLADPDFLKNIDIDSLGAQTLYEDFQGSLKGIQEAVSDKGGGAFAIRLSIQEPVKASQKPLVADLDKADKKKEESQTQEKGEYEVKEKTHLKLPKLNVKNQFLKEKNVEARKFVKKAWIITREYLRKASFIILSPWLPRAPGSLEEATLKKRQRIVQVVVVLAAILVISIGVNLFNHSRRVSQEKFQESISLVENKLQDAKNLKDINSSQARSLIVEAKEELAKLSDKDPKVIELDEKLETLLAQINKIFKVKLKEFVDLSTLKGGIDTKRLKLVGSQIFVLDKGTGSVYKVVVSKKAASILVSEKKGLQNFAPTGEFVHLQTTDGIFKVDSETGREEKIADPSSDWKNLVAGDSYRNNVYLLDRGAKQIWKHVPAGSGLSAPRGYFTEEFKKEPTSFSVDGAIWVGSKNEIFKYFGGNKDKFSVSDAPKKFSNIVDVYTKEGLSNLYVLDRGESGIFVIEKSSGAYLGFYSAGELASADAITIDEANKTGYVLHEDTISSFKLN
jgi:hypothetical protein